MPFSKKRKNIIESRQSLFYKKKSKENGNIDIKITSQLEKRKKVPSFSENKEQKRKNRKSKAVQLMSK